MKPWRWFLIGFKSYNPRSWWWATMFRRFQSFYCISAGIPWHSSLFRLGVSLWSSRGNPHNSDRFRATASTLKIVLLWNPRIKFVGRHTEQILKLRYSNYLAFLQLNFLFEFGEIWCIWTLAMSKHPPTVLFLGLTLTKFYSSTSLVATIAVPLPLLRSAPTDLWTLW